MAEGSKRIEDWKVDIFIKTYHKDFEWLRYCLASIKRFARGFRQVVLVVDHPQPVKIPPDWLWQDCRIVEVPLPPRARGYVWQQCVKLNWYNYTDADAVFILDSDTMFTKPSTLSDFCTNGKFHWFLRDWSTAGLSKKWHAPVERLMMEPVPYEAMCAPGFVLTREMTIAFKNHFCSRHGTTEIWHAVRDKTQEDVSEFNMLGNFIHKYKPQDYTCLINVDFSQYANCQNLRQTWSWGGLKDDERQIRDQLLK